MPTAEATILQMAGSMPGGYNSTSHFHEDLELMDLLSKTSVNTNYSVLIREFDFELSAIQHFSITWLTREISNPMFASGFLA